MKDGTIPLLQSPVSYKNNPRLRRAKGSEGGLARLHAAKRRDNGRDDDH